jgi:hypothetical protein
MVKIENNLLLDLHKFAVRQDENFMTEAFAHMLRHLLKNEPRVGMNLLEKMTNGRLELGPEDVSDVQIATQVTKAYGRPDIEIRTPDHLIYIEVKAESEVSDDQLTRYREDLEKSGFQKWTLILLTRYLVALDGIGGKPDFHCRWYKVAEWLEEEELKSEDTKYIVNQFLDFLKGRNMTIEPVCSEYLGGIHAFRSLLNMVGEAIASQKIPVSLHKGTWDYLGYYLDTNKYFVGIYFESPNLIRFEADTKFISDTSQVKEAQGERWIIIGELDLAAAEQHFFTLSKASQFQCIEAFVREGWNKAMELNRPDQSK